MKRPALAILFTGLALAGCSSVREAKVSESFQVNYDEVVPVRESSPDGAIYSRSQSGFFLGDRRAQRVGDVLTVTLAETMSASKTNDSAIARTGSLAASFPSALFGTGGINIPAVRSPGGDGVSNPGLTTSTTSNFAGSGAANQSNSITGNITVVVTRVYENGNLWVQGQKMLTLNQGEEFVRVSGLIRPEDIAPGNVVQSSRIAQAQISYTGSGDVHDASRQGWFGRFFSLVAPL
jgi:flagellar L-ring protein precursor FlgH